MPSIKLKLNGEPFKLQPESPTVVAALKFLMSAPPDELFTTDALAAQLKVHATSLKYARLVEGPLAPYTEKLATRRRYWGSAAAIAELRKQVRS